MPCHHLRCMWNEKSACVWMLDLLYICSDSCCLHWVPFVFVMLGLRSISSVLCLSPRVASRSREDKRASQRYRRRRFFKMRFAASVNDRYVTFARIPTTRRPATSTPALSRKRRTLRKKTRAKLRQVCCFLSGLGTVIASRHF